MPPLMTTVTMNPGSNLTTERSTRESAELGDIVRALRMPSHHKSVGYGKESQREVIMWT